MNNLYPRLLKIIFLLVSLVVLAAHYSNAQSCTPQGDQTTYGTGNVWIGYVYQGKNFDTYTGYVTEGAAGSSNFDESFGGNQVNYNTNGCAVYTENFSVRYKLTQNFPNGNYLFTVGGDDGFRLSLDGGATWAINRWNDQGYTTTTYTVALNGSTNMVLEYYENGGANRVSFNVTPICMGTGNPAVYGTNNVWSGYLYQGMNFDMYKGQVTEGASSNPNFDENFGNPGGGTVTYNTNSCSIQTQQFSARYRLTQALPKGNYVITIGGDDGYRFSLDGGATWVINRWNDQSYGVTTYNGLLNGTYNMVLEYYQNGGADRVSFSMSATLLPVTLVSWSVSALSADQAQLTWQTTDAVGFDHFVIQRSTDGASFTDVHTTAATGNGGTLQNYSYTDQYAYNGTIYYRLAMTDRDGTTNYSTIISVALHSANQSIRIYPTVIESNSLYVEASQSLKNVRLELFDMSGNKINEKDWSVLDGRQQVSVNAGHAGSLPSGAYIARLSDNRQVMAKQIIIIK
ncbi:MAG TPA: T9SS type A sorting domain-containing protein [Puia sp.]|nr:T9SS type A sorting domain-containing protein [Puia sp.]